MENLTEVQLLALTNAKIAYGIAAKETLLAYEEANKVLAEINGTREDYEAAKMAFRVAAARAYKEIKIAYKFSQK